MHGSDNQSSSGQTAPPIYQEKNPYNHNIQPTAPVRGQTKIYQNFDDLPSVPDSGPAEKKNEAKASDDDDDVSFDDLQKRFNNLKKN